MQELCEGLALLPALGRGVVSSDCWYTSPWRGLHQPCRTTQCLLGETLALSAAMASKMSFVHLKTVLTVHPMASSEHGICLKEEEGGWLILEAPILASSGISVL